MPNAVPAVNPPELGLRRAGPLRRAVSVDRVSYEDAGAKQAQNGRDCFNHFTHPNVLQ
jgi:hypothetical protein